MSLPHTGKLEAFVGETPCSFDGDVWRSADTDLAEKLNIVTGMVPTTHYTILDRAENVFRLMGITDHARIASVEADQWEHELPPDAID